ncbi:MAG: hypothetical protein IKO07_01905 [Clostridia bacterium]|nr:hypothetical protein [Clostridia bacterium]
MTPRERMITALNRGVPDRVPTFELEFQLSRELVGKEFLHEEELDGLPENEVQRRLKENAALLIEVYEKLEHDAICLHYLSLEHIGRTAEYIRELSGDRFMILAHGDGTLAIPDGAGLYELSYALFETPDEMRAKCRRMADDAIHRNDYLLDHGLDGFILCSDYCFNQGPFMSPAMFSEFITPYLRDIIAAIRARGGYAIKHTDGNIMPIIDQLASCHPHALHSLDPMAGVDIRLVKEQYGDRLALCGNVHCAAMQTGTEQDVIDSAEYCLRYGKPGGGYVYCTSNIPFRGLPLERYQLVLDVWRKYRDY